ncbi:nose resistant to fluoxetine protein 6-like [Tetranychus urticae]|uniref:nose resistant to fluoxetine protein 6-like n=1 Tax=Tetranychus urticae TaxID=32264 RepID=UPI00077B910D|nr:nose resistant to fluoxetine protein 6-like [Tetranychus urticae]
MFLNSLSILVTFGSIVYFIQSTESRYIDSWRKIENFTHHNVINYVREYENDFLTILSSIGLSSKCHSALIDYRNGLLNFDLTSVQRLDSSGKWPSGLLSGTFTDLGSFDTCVSLDSSQYCLLYTNVPLFNETGYEGFMRPYDSRLFNFTSEPFKYFQKYIHFLRRMNITTGLCVPNECSREELTFIVGKLYDKFNTGLTADVDLCYSSPSSIPWRPSEVIGLSIILLIIFLNFIGTRSPDDSLLASFNWSENCKKLFSIKPSADESMNFLDGIKVLTMLLVIIIHFQMGNMYNLYIDSFKLMQIASNPIFIFLFLAPYTVDLFLMVTGLLMGYYFFSGKRRLNLITYIIGRWIRFATTLGWIICLQFVLFSEHVHKYFGGPFWSDYNGVGSIVQSCEKTWLPTLLLNQFWFDSSKDVNVCLLFDWYLAADFTLAILFLFVLIPYLKNHPKLSIINTIILIFVGLAISGLGIHFLGIPTTWITTNYQRKAFLQYSFDFNLKPWPHISPYFVGVLCGYISSRPKLKLSQFTLVFGWLVCIFCLSLNFTYEYVVNRFGIDPEYKIALAYGTVSKTIWAIGWAWIILILKLGFASSVSNFLSRPTFRILSRINLSVLCINMLIIRLRSASARTFIFPSSSDVLLFYYLPIYIIIYAAAMVSALLVEFPTVNLLKRLFLKPKSRQPET